MATKFGRIEHSEVSFEEQTFHKNQTITNESIGCHGILGLEDHKKDSNSDSDLSVSGSHWAFVHNMFYLSGSAKVLREQPADAEKFNSIYDNFNQHNDLKPFYKHKFYNTASVFYIPQATFGERIQPESFTFTARTGSASNTSKEIIIKDDGNGNLYSSNAHHSQSAGALTSADNYVGNIFYDLGVAVLTETGSWSGSLTYPDGQITYMDIGQTSSIVDGDYRYWNMNFNSTTPFFVSQYSVKVNSSDFLSTMNASTKLYHGGDYIPSGSSLEDVANLKSDLTGSGWKPYFNQIQLFREDNGEEPLLIANLPRAVKMRDDIDLIITFRVDH